MAIWQFPIYFIPKQSLFEKYGCLPPQLEMDKDGWSKYLANAAFEKEPESKDALAVQWWLPLNIDISTLLPILRQFGDLQEWTAHLEGLRSFGDSEANDVCVCFRPDTGKVEEFSCRLDLRQVNKDFVGRLLSFAVHYDCLFMDRIGRIYNPTHESLIRAIELSNTKRFVEDPKQFLKDLSQGIAKPE